MVNKTLSSPPSPCANAKAAFLAPGLSTAASVPMVVGVSWCSKTVGRGEGDRRGDGIAGRCDDGHGRVVVAGADQIIAGEVLQRTPSGSGASANLVVASSVMCTVTVVGLVLGDVRPMIVAVPFMTQEHWQPASA